MFYAIGDTRSLHVNGWCTIEELLALGNYGWISPDVVKQKDLIRRHVPINRVVTTIGCDHFPDSEEVLDEFNVRKLRRPTFEEALYFGAKFPDEQLKHPIVLRHEPLVLSPGYEVIVVLDVCNSKRVLDLLQAHGTWGHKCVYPAIMQE